MNFLKTFPWDKNVLFVWSMMQPTYCDVWSDGWKVWRGCCKSLRPKLVCLSGLAQQSWNMQIFSYNKFHFVERPLCYFSRLLKGIKLVKVFSVSYQFTLLLKHQFFVWIQWTIALFVFVKLQKMGLMLSTYLNFLIY